MDKHFKPISAQEWKQLIQESLRSATYDDLTWEIASGVRGKPDYSEADAPEPIVFIPRKKREEKWLVKASLIIKTFDKANQAALELLMSGVNSVEFIGSINRDDDVQTLLKDIELPYVQVFFGPQNNPGEFLEYFFEHIKARHFAAEKIEGGMSYDPIGTLALRGNWIHNEIRDRENFKHLISACIDHNLRNFRPVLIDASGYHNSGGDVVWELACALSHANEYLQWMRTEDIPVEKGFRHLHFQFASGRKYFGQIAKFRAFRPLWANVCEAHGIDPQDAGEVFVSAETSLRERSPVDPHTNLIRTTTQAMSAVIGGCDALRIFPFDHGLAEESESGNRLARNIQLVLNEEAKISAVEDAAAGAYLFDRLSADIMEQAWSAFKAIESEGGLVAALKSGWIQEKINEQAAIEDDRIRDGKSVYVGLNKYMGQSEDNTARRNTPASTAMESKQIDPLSARPAAESLASSKSTES